MKKILIACAIFFFAQANETQDSETTALSSCPEQIPYTVRPELARDRNLSEGRKKPKPAKPSKPAPTEQELIQSPPKPPKPSKPPVTEAEASAILQVAGGFFTIITAPNDPTHVTTGIGAMASGMANLFYQLMKSKGLNPELSDDELENLAEQMADMVSRGVEIEMVRRSN